VTTIDARIDASTGWIVEEVHTSLVSPERCHLGEGPTYDAATDTAWWFDIVERRLFEARLGTGEVRVHDLPFMASALAYVDDARQLIAAEDGLYLRHIADGRIEPLVAVDLASTTRSIAAPALQTSCPVFVGADYSRLLVTSAYEHMSDAARAADPEHGRTFILNPGVRGRPEPCVRLGGA
jgi:sugar lactone lactonase YvrE